MDLINSQKANKMKMKKNLIKQREIIHTKNVQAPMLNRLKLTLKERSQKTINNSSIESSARSIIIKDVHAKSQISFKSIDHRSIKLRDSDKSPNLSPLRVN